jgi:competence protein ComEC
MGIALWAIPLMRHTTHPNTLVRYLLHTIIVGVVATLWTLPIVSHTFGNIPIIGIAITPIAMISAYVILGCGIFTLLLPTPLGSPFAWMADKAALAQNELVAASSMPEWASIEYRLETPHIAICYLIFIAITIAIWSYERKKVITLPKYDNI